MVGERLSRLVPQPHRAQVGTSFPTPDAMIVNGDWADGLPLSLPATGANPHRLTICRDPELSAQHYRLRFDADGAVIHAGDRAGAWNGLQTATQWWRAHRGQQQISALEVEDRPAFIRRGVTLDVSRCRVPTMRHLQSLVDTLAGWKINQLQLYTEHTFAYAGHSEVWRESSPLTADEVRRLAGYCAAREIRLVPNQNSLGHFHRWLKHPSYRHLAECPDGIEHPFSAEVEPYGLCAADPQVLDLLRDLYAQLLPNFDGDRFHVGCDEPIDLGRCRLRQRASDEGKAALFVDHVLELRRLAERWGRRIEIWADAPLADPHILEYLPEDVRLQVWGYEAGHDFAAAIETLNGRDFDVCSGTSSWASLGGRTENALANLRRAARQGAGTAGGLVITDWGDFGHPQPPAVSELGFLAGADVAWNGDGRDDAGYRRLLEEHLGGGGAGEALFDLGRVHEPLQTPNVNGTPLFHLLFHWRDPLTHDRYRGLNANDLDRVRSRVDAIAPPAADHPLAAEIAWVRDGLRIAADLGRARLEVDGGVEDVVAGVRAAIGERLAAWRRAYNEVWLSTSRSGGLAESAAPIDALLAALSS